MDIALNKTALAFDQPIIQSPLCLEFNGIKVTIENAGAAGLRAVDAVPRDLPPMPPSPEFVDR